MSQGYKLRFDQLKEGDPTQTDYIASDERPAAYQSDGSIRNFCLVFKDGNMEDFPYSYVMRTRYDIGDVKNSIIIRLPAYKITLSGYKLISLFFAFKKQLPQFIYEIDERYADKEGSAVTDMKVEEIE